MLFRCHKLRSLDGIGSSESSSLSRSLKSLRSFISLMLDPLDVVEVEWAVRLYFAIRSESPVSFEGKRWVSGPVWYDVDENSYQVSSSSYSRPHSEEDPEPVAEGAVDIMPMGPIIYETTSTLFAVLHQTPKLLKEAVCVLRIVSIFNYTNDIKLIKSKMFIFDVSVHHEFLCYKFKT